MPNVGLPPIDTGSASVASTRVELEALGMVDTPEGQDALALAAAIDSGRSLMALPAMVKEKRATLDALRDRAPKVKDSTDDFTARREERRKAAGF